MKAASESIRKLEGRIEQQLSENGLLDESEIAEFRAKLEQETMRHFREKLMNSEQPDPQVLQNLKRKMDGLITEFIERNKKSWQQKYRQLSENAIGELRDKIFKEEYKDYNQFLQDFNKIKEAYERETGTNPEKWSHFNEIAESLHRLAGQAIITKIANSTKIENEILQKKIQLREVEFNQKRRELDEEKESLKSRVEELERSVARYSSSQSLKEQTMKDLKQQNARLKQKCNSLQQTVHDKEREMSRINNEVQRTNTIQMQQVRSQLRILRSNLEKQKSLQEMEKEFHQKEIESYREKVSHYETQTKRLKTTNSNISNQLQDLRSRL